MQERLDALEGFVLVFVADHDAATSVFTARMHVQVADAEVGPDRVRRLDGAAVSALPGQDGLPAKAFGALVRSMTPPVRPDGVEAFGHVGGLEEAAVHARALAHEREVFARTQVLVAQQERAAIDVALDEDAGVLAGDRAPSVLGAPIVRRATDEKAVDQDVRGASRFPVVSRRDAQFVRPRREGTHRRVVHPPVVGRMPGRKTSVNRERERKLS